MDDIVSLVIPFIAMIFFIGMTENIVEELENLFNRKIHEAVGYFLVLVLAFAISMLGDYRFFEYLDVTFQYDWMDWMMSAFVIAAGSGFLEKKFDIINTIPSVISGVRINRSKKKDDHHNKDDSLPPI
ncbi:hypothetical protein [Tindallia californiensis]|uniref:Uncharacterized protein n=1 Tax=Tindallia californiensis TaxID=159292 RepID=A0A1H3R216_9FIRM|nr:hypothetical protein [Tindallia californiensis]SDZ19660.1 hypothetical protein SAMN05192546_11192 [Tindallia californiensis]